MGLSVADVEACGDRVVFGVPQDAAMTAAPTRAHTLARMVVLLNACPHGRPDTRSQPFDLSHPYRNDATVVLAPDMRKGPLPPPDVVRPWPGLGRPSTLGMSDGPMRRRVEHEARLRGWP